MVGAMTISTMIKKAMRKKRFRSLKATACAAGVSTEIFRRTVNEGAIPKDSTLVKIAKALEIDPAALVLACHRQKLPASMRGEFLTPQNRSRPWEQKRRYPLSQEQCDYLSTVMSNSEIQLIRKCRQLTPEEQQHAIAYIDYQFAENRIPPSSEHPEQYQHYHQHHHVSVSKACK